MEPLIEKTLSLTESQWASLTIPPDENSPHELLSRIRDTVSLARGRGWLLASDAKEVMDAVDRLREHIPPAEKPISFRSLEAGEIIKRGDQWYCEETGLWSETHDAGRVISSDRRELKYRRFA